MVDDTLLSWEAPARPFKKRDKEFFITVVAFIFLVSTICFFIKEWFLIAVFISLGFLVYVLYSVPPEKVANKITDKGIVGAGELYLFKEIGEFWFEEKWDQEILVFTFRPPFGGRIYLMLGDQKREEVKKNLIKNIPFKEKIEKSWVEKTSEWLAKKFPLEKPKTS